MEAVVQKKPVYVMTAEEVLELKLKEVPMLCSPILQKVGVASLCGSSDGGKSFLCLCLAIAICSDDDEIIGLKIRKEHGSVIIVCTEDTAEDICVRLTALLGDKKLNDGKLRFIFETENVPKKLKEELERQPADLVMMDTFGDLFPGNLNDSIEVRKFLRPYKEIAKDKKCLLLFCHHIGKGKENNNSPSKNDVLGSQAIESACRTVLMLRKRADAKRILTVVKGNNIPDELKNKGIIMDFSSRTGFTPTGETVNFGEMESSVEDNIETNVDAEVVALYEELKSYQKVADAMRLKGHRIDKNKVGRILKKHRPSVPNTRQNDGTDDDNDNKSKISNMEVKDGAAICPRCKMVNCLYDADTSTLECSLSCPDCGYSDSYFYKTDANQKFVLKDETKGDTPDNRIPEITIIDNPYGSLIREYANGIIKCTPVADEEKFNQLVKELDIKDSNLNRCYLKSYSDGQFEERLVYQA